MGNLNAELYSKELLDYWVNRNKLISAEKYLLNKYLIDPTKNVLEAGTGGGRISFYIEGMGFQNISSFDIVPEMINHAKKIAQTKNSNIEFEIADAVNLSKYKNETYNYLIYLQQVLCFIPKTNLFSDALKESYRVAKKNAIVIFSFLDFDSRVYNSSLSLIINFLRKIRREETSKQQLPWIKIKNKFNWKLLNKNQAITYWLKKDEIISELESIGFSILEAKNANQLNSNSKTRKGMLYIVCKK